MRRRIGARGISCPIFGATPDEGRVVVDGNLITGGGVTAGIDLALEVVAWVRGREMAEARQLSLEYAPAPPFDAGRPETAPPAAVARVTDAMREFLQARRNRAQRAARRIGLG